MARAYHVDIAAVAAQADPKWVDNLLSHFTVAGVESAKQGVARRMSIDAVRTVVLTRALSRDGGLSVERALTSATRLLSADHGRIFAAPFVELALDRPGFDADVDRKIAAAVEAVVPRRRGRPPGRK